jgi:predicted nucleic acid-binding protein
MILVVDASALAAVLFGEPEGVEMAAYLRDETLVAPSLIDYELANIGLKKIRRDAQREAQISGVLRGAKRLKMERVAVPPEEALELASRTGLTAYDASYLWVALSKDAELVTLDNRLARANEALRER